MSSFFIPNIACMARFTASRSGSFSSFSQPAGQTCHDRPYLSLSQPQGPSSPPSESVSQ